jgi:parallel beta-helix repeat protein
VLRGNTIINHENPSHPLRTTLQGIGCFDGWFEDWVIENNVVITDHWHGISLYGAINCRIVNNTVIDLYSGTPGPCWIAIQPHKDGTPSANCIVRNNLTNSLNIATGQTNVTQDHNILVTNPALFFVDPATYDMRLLQTSAAVDSGSNTLMPSHDRDQIGRPYNSIVDVGAYEWHPAGWTGPPGGGGGSGGDSGGSDGGCTTDTHAGWLWLLVLGLVAAALHAGRHARG